MTMAGSIGPNLASSKKDLLVLLILTIHRASIRSMIRTISDL